MSHTRYPVRPIVTDVTMTCLDAPPAGGATVPTTLVYDVEDPFAVELVFHTVEGEIAWLVGRELLMEGMDHLAGQGDVCVWPAEDGTHVYIRLQAPGGRQLLRAPSEALDDFLWRSLALLPLGSEGTWLDVDGLVEACLELH